MLPPISIYLSAPHMGGAELEFVREAFETNWVSTVGPHLTRFEREMGELLNRHAVAVSSGTAAIHLGLRLLNVKPGDEVLCPSLTFVASCNPIRYCGAKAIFIDSERRSWNLDPVCLRDAIVGRIGAVGRPPKAIVAVHLYGQTADMDAVQEVCAEFGVEILEDAAEALGANHGGVPAGGLSRLAAVSFNGNKIITTSGGGMLLCESASDAEKARYWATQARDPGVAYEHSELGYNYRMSNVLAGIGRGQLSVLADRVAARRAVFYRYLTALPEEFVAMPEAPWGLHTRWLSTFLLPTELIRDHCIGHLRELGIEARPVWKPMHLQRLFESSPRFGGEVAEDLFERGICLPSSSDLMPQQQDKVIAALDEAIRCAV